MWFKPLYGAVYGSEFKCSAVRWNPQTRSNYQISPHSALEAFRTQLQKDSVP